MSLVLYHVKTARNQQSGVTRTNSMQIQLQTQDGRSVHSAADTGQTVCSFSCRHRTDGLFIQLQTYGAGWRPNELLFNNAPRQIYCALLIFPLKCSYINHRKSPYTVYTVIYGEYFLSWRHSEFECFGGDGNTSVRYL